MAAAARKARSASTFGPGSTSRFRGVWPIMATPFRASDESVDLDAFGKAVRFMADAGADGATIVGVLGESNRLTDREREGLIRTALASVAELDFPICVGTSHAGTAATVELSQMAQELGAYGVMVTPTKEAAPVADAALVSLFARVADGCPGLPIVVQDHPASTQVHMAPSLVARICHEVPSVACVKMEALPTPARIAALRACWSAELPPAADCTILTGLGALYGAYDLEQGTDGFMTGFAFPEILMAMNRAAQAAEWERVHALYARYLPLLVFEQQPGVAVRKELYQLRGLFAEGHVRHPATGAVAPVLAKGLRAQLARSLPGVDVAKPLPAALFE